jgi:ubiquinone/menaquinone biosynthesis C-methylase UbiE
VTARVPAGRTGSDIYDTLAPHYREYAQGRQAYLAAVDRFILQHAPATVDAVLDVGAGDGVRGMALARSLKAQRVVLCEPSREMAARCRRMEPDAVWEASAEQLPESSLRFDVILCLWNVLGHIADPPRRLAALKSINRLLAPAGVLFIDVNNRHNAAAYGRLKVLARRCVDFLSPDERRGDAVYEWKMGGHTLPAMGHLFTPAEIEGMIAESGMRVARRLAVDYATGEFYASPYRGQLLYQAARLS